MIFQRLIAILLSFITIPFSVFTQTSSLFNNTFDVELDENTQAVLDIIKDNSYLDIEKILTNFPDINTTSKLANQIFQIDREELRNRLYLERDKYYLNGESLKGHICYFIGAYFSTFERCEVTFEQISDGTQEFVLNIYYADDYTETLYTGITYYPDTGEFKGRNGKGILDLGFNLDYDEMIIYAVMNCWMRNFGFCLEYDLFCYLTPFFFYNTRRFKFEYDEKEWLIQIWKGKYVITNGAEVGVYNRDKKNFGSFYESAGDDDLLNMSFELYHEDELIFSKEEEQSWWINGFKLSTSLYNANELTLKFTVELNDEQMLKAFCNSVSKNIYKDVSYSIDGLKVILEW